MKPITSAKKIWNDLMFIIKEAKVYNFDDGTIYSFSLKYQEANQKLSHDMHIILNWSTVDSVVANPGKFKIKFLGST